MKDYILKTAPNAGEQTWNAAHPFYQSATVLAIDIGIEGIGLALRKGPQPLWAQTFEVSLPTASPLKDRRLKRGGRRTRSSRKARDIQFKKWCVEFGLLTQEQADKLWRDQNRHDEEPAREANRVFDHRLRAVTTGVGSAECVAVCLRHIVKHRGFDYHQTEEGSHPWGDEWKYADILDWLRKTPISQEYADELRREIRDMPDIFSEDKFNTLSRAMDGAVERYKDNPVEKMLREHCKEKGHPNLRVSGRRHNFPRELLKLHAHAILNHPRHKGMIPAEKLEAAMLRLLGRRDPEGNWLLTERVGKGKTMTDPGCIMDYHRRTRKKAEELWERKAGKCPYAEALSKSGHPIEPVMTRSHRRDLRIRRFMLLQFLAERTFVAANFQRHYAGPALIQWALAFLEEDEAAMSAKTARPKVTAAQLKKRWIETAGVRLAKDNESHNKDYFEQLKDLLCAPQSDFAAKASLSAESAAILHAVATLQDTNFEAECVKDRLRGLGYYQWRVNNVSNWGLYPQVEFLLGARSQYDQDGNSKDTRDSEACRRRGEDRSRWGCALADGRPQEHGILRRLFAGQLKDAHGRPVSVREQMNREDGLPDYVVIEVVGDMPRNLDDKLELQKAAKAKRQAKDDIFEHYGVPSGASDGLKKKALLFDQQVNAEEKLVCPYTGRVLEGMTPHSAELEVEHIYPQQRGGLTVMDNLCITLRTINAAKGNQTPFEIAGRTIDGVTFLPWPEMKTRLSGFRWGKGKRGIFEWDQTGVPDFQNMTRMAQLARQLKTEIVNWLGIRHRAAAEIEDPTRCEAAIQQETWQRIGTPVGGMTHACAEVWSPKETFPDYWREVKFGTRTDWVKERLCQRHHLWDALILSHIPPGAGMNNTFCGGIFRVTEDEETGTPVLKPLPGLGPDLDALNKQQQDECLVVSPRQRNSKQPRTQETIQSRADDKGRHWSRESLSKYTAKAKMTETKVIQLLKDAGMPPKAFTHDGEESTGLKYLHAWWNERNPERFTLTELEQFLEHNSVMTPEVRAALPEWWKDKKTGEMPDERKVSAAAIGALLLAGKFSKAELSDDGRLSESTRQGWLSARASLAELRLPSFKEGHPGQPVRRVAMIQDRKAPASYIPHHNRESRLEQKAAIGVKTTNEACRSFKLYERVVKDATGKVIERKYWRLKLPPPRNLHNYAKLHGKAWQPAPEDVPPSDAVLVGTLVKGQLLRVPIGVRENFAKRGEAATHGWWWYRVASLGYKDGEVELKLAEYKEPKAPEKDKTDRRSAREKLIAEIWLLRPKSPPDLAYLIELNQTQRVQTAGWKIIEADPKPDKKSGTRAASKKTAKPDNNLHLPTMDDPPPDTAGG
ncbi:MAG: hypothetical protein HS117_27140 [Verrucomicrobiaceae bacterium]|nr:hypothetical protein [Verrucomicrobiaceae bacterium]